MSPWIIGFCGLVVYPMLASLAFSFTNYDLLNTPRFVGLDNYVVALTGDPVVWAAIRNTLWMIAIAVPAKILFALGLALALAQLRAGSSVFRTLIYLPAMVPNVAAGLAFSYLLNAAGPLNQFLGWLGLPQPLWFHDPAWAKPGLMMIMIWAAGNTMVILLAAVLDAPRQLYEAAELDGAGAIRKFTAITLPSISPVLYFALLTGIIDGFQYFTQAYVTSLAVSGDSAVLGAPRNSTMFFMTWLYQQGFSYFKVGYASALAWILFVAIMAVTALLAARSRSLVYYAAD